jgi:hypothetical protein
VNNYNQAWLSFALPNQHQRLTERNYLESKEPVILNDICVWVKP